MRSAAPAANRTLVIAHSVSVGAWADVAGGTLLLLRGRWSREIWPSRAGRPSMRRAKAPRLPSGARVSGPTRERCIAVRLPRSAGELMGVRVKCFGCDALIE